MIIVHVGDSLKSVHYSLVALLRLWAARQVPEHGVPKPNGVDEFGQRMTDERPYRCGSGLKLAMQVWASVHHADDILDVATSDRIVVATLAERFNFGCDEDNRVNDTDGGTRRQRDCVGGTNRFGVPAV